MSPVKSNETLNGKIQEWMIWNKKEDEIKEVQSLVDKGDVCTLEALFMRRIEFGTAGLRARLGPGYSQMNDLVVIQTAQGLLSFLKQTKAELLQTNGIVIGYDGRYGSLRFAQLTAGIFLRGGCPVHMFSQVCPTPFVPFAVNLLKAAAGVMVTASHNPKEDNGYKVYRSNGAQIVSPEDKQISDAILKCLTPTIDVWKPEKAIEDNKDMFDDPLDRTREAYTNELLRRLYDSSLTPDFPSPITYTAMHGVGYPYVKHVFKAAKFREMVPVPEQVEPDPEFPTVKYPNPEEGKSCLDLAFRTAGENKSTVILANDPDADRLAVAELNTATGEWKVFTGNEIGALLGWWELTCYKIKCEPPEHMLKDCYFLSSTVSSKILKTIAQSEKLSFEETLTGFKWMGNRADELVKEGKKVLLAFEEAIGFMCGTTVLDKDGVGAALRCAELVAYLNKMEPPLTLTQQLQKIYDTYGYHISENSYYLCYEPIVIKKIFDRLRNFEGAGTYPKTVMNGKYRVTSVRDLTTGFDSSQPDNKAVLPVSQSSQMITFNYENGLVATLRTSGTEPKIKYYTELCAKPEDKDLESLKATLSSMVQSIVEEYLQPELNKLIPKSS